MGATDRIQPRRDPGHPRLAVASALVPPFALIGGWTIAAALQADFDPVRESISALAAGDTPHRWVMTLGLVLTGAAHILTAYALPHRPRHSRVLLALGGLAVWGVAAVPLPARADSSVAHTMVATLSFMALAIWPLRRDPRRHLPDTVAAGVMVALIIATGLATAGSWATFGLIERLAAGAQALWPLVAAARALRAAGVPLVRGPVMRVLLVGPLFAGAIIGGVAATTLAPATAQTRLFSAQLTLSLNPANVSTLIAHTTFGDVDVSFHGLAPGIVMTPAVRSEITALISSGATDLSSLQPSPAELDRAIGDAARALAWRFGIGAVLGVVLTAGLLALIAQATRRRRLSRRDLLWPSIAGLVVAMLVTGIGLLQTFKPARQASFRATGLIGLVQANAGLLGEVEARAGQVTPYLRNLLALSSALQEKYTPGSPAEPATAKILLVSDIHDGNAYALMRTIVQQEGITAVIDSGDIVTFGRPDELDAAGIPAGIESLGVPYLFIKGNHDGAGRDDLSVLARLARVPNVVLLQPNSTLYREATINGIRIGGFNDPRYFGDSGTNTAAAQKPAEEQFLATFSPRSPLDIAVGHEPAAVRGLPRASLLINGHMHVRDLEGNRIQVGTFTGGGPFSHFLENSEGEELVGQPSAFDILSFGRDCRLQTLTRYTFHNVIEGRPAYDDISLINGSTVQKVSPDDTGDRLCIDGSGLAVTDVPAVPADSTDQPASSTPATAETTAETSTGTGTPSTPAATSESGTPTRSGT